MTWLDVDGARDYLGGRENVSRKTIYAMVKAGLRTAPRGDSGKRFWFCAEWIDEFQQQRSEPKPRMHAA